MKFVKEYYELCKKYCHEENHILLIQKGNFYSAFSFPDNIGSAVKLAEVCSLQLSLNNKNFEFSMENPKMTGFQIYEQSLQKHFKTLYDNEYKFTLFNQKGENPTSRIFVGTYNQSFPYQFGDKLEESVKNIYAIIIDKPCMKKDRFILHYVYLELSTGSIYFGEYIDIDVHQILMQFFSAHVSMAHCIVHVYRCSVEEKEKVREIVCIRNYKVEDLKMVSKEKIDNEIMESFLESIDIPEILYQMNIYHIVLFLKETDPSRCKCLRFDEKNYQRSQSTRYLVVNMDLMRELHVNNDEREERNKYAKCKSLFDLLSVNMNVMSKRELNRRLNTPYTNVKDMEESYHEINMCEKMHTSLEKQPDFQMFFKRYQTGNIKPKVVGQVLKKYKLMMKWYPELEEVYQFIESKFQLEKMIECNDFLVHYPKDIQEKREKIEKIELDIRTFNRKYDTSFQMEDLSFQMKKNQKNMKLVSDFGEKIIVQPRQTKTHIKFFYRPYMEKIQEYKHHIEEVDIFREKEYDEITDELFERFGGVIHSTNKKMAVDGMNSGLKHFFEKNKYVQPKIDKNSPCSFHKIEKGRHPISERNFGKEMLYTPFDSEINENLNGELIYGCNTAGKSSYLKMVGSHLYLAQCGFFVPCLSMEFYPYQQIFSQLSHQDNLFENKSLFEKDITDIQYCVNRASPYGSIILGDELLSSTEIMSQSGLVMSYINFFQKNNIRFLFSSHLHLISESLSYQYKDRIRMRYIHKKEVDERPTILMSSDVNDFYDREMIDGTGDKQYGVRVAERLKIPEEIIWEAKDFIKNINISVFTGQSKSSKYNRSVKKTGCQICGSRNQMEIHHIIPQRDFDETMTIQGFHRDGKYNLLCLCRTCHEKVTIESYH